MDEETQTPGEAQLMSTKLSSWVYRITLGVRVLATLRSARGVSAGGNIMIHGILNGWGLLGPLLDYWDWTNGCIAVTNADMREIWSLGPNGTPITIQE